MDGPAFDEGELFARIADSGARVLLIGRRALVALGLPLLTADYDLWSHPDDFELLNAALVPLGLSPSCPPQVARAQGRYVLENDEHIDVLVARAMQTVDGERVAFDALWQRRRSLRFDDQTTIAVPAISDLILTKRCGGRERDLADIRMLELLQREDA